MNHSFILLGDFCPIGNSIAAKAETFRPFEDVRGLLNSRGKIICNLECPITQSDQCDPAKWANLKIASLLLPVFAGVDGVCLANNHISDFSKKGAFETLEHLNRMGISHAGYGGCLRESLRPMVIPLEGGSLAVVSLCCLTTNGSNLASYNEPGVAPISPDLIRDAIKLARKDANVVLLYMHWGCEWVHQPVASQLRLARFAIDCGADAVVGCHSHTIQAYEQYKGRWIFYGLGNFVFGKGFANVIAQDGTLSQQPLRSEAANRESLAVEFRISDKPFGAPLELVSVTPLYFDPDSISLSVAKSLVFNTEHENHLLERFVQAFGKSWSSPPEVAYVAKVRHGVPAYWHNEEPITEDSLPGYGQDDRKSFTGIAKEILPESVSNQLRSIKYLARKATGKLTLSERIELKWKSDSKQLPLQAAHRELYHIIHRKTYETLNDFPDLVNCRDFNDRIQWLKLFDQNELIIRCCDKLLVRDYIASQVGPDYLVPIYQIADSVNAIDFDALPTSFVIKTNHDSGSVKLVRDKFVLNKSNVIEFFHNALCNKYGIENGEWAYQFIRPKVFVEKLLGEHKDSPPPDYKFYVVDGFVKFMHFIYDRGCDTKEQVLSVDGSDLGLELYPTFESGKGFLRPQQWDKMLEVASIVGRGFKCVRVDMFLVDDAIYVGELTFWPMYGCYQGCGQKVLGQLLDFDRTTYRRPICFESYL
jgi:hypothetical protein